MAAYVSPWGSTLTRSPTRIVPVRTIQLREINSRWSGRSDAGAATESIVLDVPGATSQKFCIAQMGIKPELLRSHGWETVPGEIISKTPGSYRDFIQRSRAEFSVPKNGYVAMRGGWFSDRSVCYLASGRPVVIEDTGLADWLPILLMHLLPMPLRSLMHRIDVPLASAP